MRLQPQEAPSSQRHGVGAHDVALAAQNLLQASAQQVGLALDALHQAEAVQVLAAQRKRSLVLASRDQQRAADALQKSTIVQCYDSWQVNTVSN